MGWQKRRKERLAAEKDMKFLRTVEGKEEATLEELESIAEKEFEERADKWVRAIAKREGASFDELRPHLVSLFHEKRYQTKLVFDIPGHTLIRLFSDVFDFGVYGYSVAHLIDGELMGRYDWSVWDDGDRSWSYDPSHNLGCVLVLARQIYEKAKGAETD